MKSCSHALKLLFAATIAAFLINRNVSSVSPQKNPNEQIQKILKNVFSSSQMDHKDRDVPNVLPWKKPSIVAEFKPILHFQSQEKWIKMNSRSF